MMEKDDGIKTQEALLLINMAEELHMPTMMCSKCSGTGKIVKNTRTANVVYAMVTGVFLALGITGTISYLIPSLQPLAIISSLSMTIIFLMFAINMMMRKY